MADKELLEKGDASLVFGDGKLKVKVVTSAADMEVGFKLGYVIDKLEEVLPGDQKSLAAMLKGALGVA